MGKPVHPLVVPTDDAYEALIRIGRAIGAREIVLGASKRLRPKVQLDRFEQFWKAGKGGDSQTSTLRVLGEGRDDRRELSAARQV